MVVLARCVFSGSNRDRHLKLSVNECPCDEFETRGRATNRLLSAFAWSTDKTFTLSSRRGSPPIDHTHNTLAHSSPAQPLQTFTNNHRVLLRRRMRLTLFDACVHTQLLRTGAAAESAVVLIYARTQIFLSFFPLVLCALCVCWCLGLLLRGASPGATGSPAPRALQLLCASHGYRCALAEPRRLLDLSRQNRVKGEAECGLFDPASS